MQVKLKKTKPNKPLLKNGKLFFTRETERRVFFIMTLIMLVFGIMMKIV